MLRGWLRAPLPGPAPPAWKGAGAAGRGLSGALRARAAATRGVAAEEEPALKGLGPRRAGLTGGTPGPRAPGAAAGCPRSGLSEPVFVSAPGEGRVMSLLPGAGKQRRDKVTYPAPCPRPASPLSGGLRPGRSRRMGRAARAPRPGRHGLEGLRAPGRAVGAATEAAPPGGSCSPGLDAGAPARGPPSACAPAPPASGGAGSAQHSPGARGAARRKRRPRGRAPNPGPGWGIRGFWPAAERCASA